MHFWWLLVIKPILSNYSFSPMSDSKLSLSTVASLWFQGLAWGGGCYLLFSQVEGRKEDWRRSKKVDIFIHNYMRWHFFVVCASLVTFEWPSPCFLWLVPKC